MAHLLKVHGSQNSFFILDQTQLQTPLSDKELVTFTQKITNPQNNVLNGADGVLVVNKPVRTGAVAQMRVINADGSEASMCGNGLRTVARYIAERDNLTDFKVDTMNTSLRVRKHEDLALNVPAFAVEISPVRFDHTALPFNNLGHDRLLDTPVPELLPGLRFSALAVPNPHLISFVSKEELAGPDLGELGTRLNSNNPYFSDGVNVNFGHILGHNTLFVKTFERGVGFTNACGTGMSATSLAFALVNPSQVTFNEPISVYNPGGMVKTVLHHDAGTYWIELIGNATFTHKLEISESALHQAQLDIADVKETNEQQAYENFINNLPTLNL
ncbi:diaminopimelate epimerase [Limosilactobacillus sp. STM2_1]|uniref:Diaminopimelate epimerase n=1 Tax=Limosilactobacillus rudii TaxID=2759755 RepID=A0A7W3UKC1_9LACO|nr:diaminopimelate epimerase [Limosilactobacillus rudii]MBB1078558.1 diaminopimelate epimerase [Limosilactobacillus rudii]MBB1097198.1 diaminopimelate epimerase [Limosilactobacillus rudii]MCD7133886.1 diaminopimelate epimerase [Limosilactobacillus rudii]